MSLIREADPDEEIEEFVTSAAEDIESIMKSLRATKAAAKAQIEAAKAMSEASFKMTEALKGWSLEETHHVDTMIGIGEVSW